MTGIKEILENMIVELAELKKKVDKSKIKVINNKYLFLENNIVGGK